MNIDELKSRIARLPRVRLAHLPTPLEELPRFSQAVGAKVFIKRDDCTGLAFGGNKARQLEFTLGDALAQGADCVIQGAAAQSNHCRQAAAAAAKLGLKCHLVLTKDEKSEPVQGNLLLDYLLGAQVHWFEGTLGEELETEKKELAERLKAQGLKPYVLTPPRSTALSAIGYVNALCEFAEQMQQMGIQADAIYVSSAGATQAGLLLGAKALGLKMKVIGIAPIRWAKGNETHIAEAANNAAELLGLDVTVSEDEIINDCNFIGERYGVFTDEAKQALELLARTEGILLDPSYTAKALAGLIAQFQNIQTPKHPNTQTPKHLTTIFWHTGGTPALFAYADEVMR